MWSPPETDPTTRAPHIAEHPAPRYESCCETQGYTLRDPSADAYGHTRRPLQSSPRKPTLTLQQVAMRHPASSRASRPHPIRQPKVQGRTLGHKVTSGG